MCSLAERPIIPELPPQLHEYLRLNTGLAVGSVSLGQVACFPTHYYSKLCVAILQFQGKWIETYKIWWIAGQPFRKLGKHQAD